MSAPLHIRSTVVDACEIDTPGDCSVLFESAAPGHGQVFGIEREMRDLAGLVPLERQVHFSPPGSTQRFTPLHPVDGKFRFGQVGTDFDAGFLIVQHRKAKIGADGTADVFIAQKADIQPQFTKSRDIGNPPGQIKNGAERNPVAEVLAPGNIRRHAGDHAVALDLHAAFVDGQVKVRMFQVKTMQSVGDGRTAKPRIGGNLHMIQFQIQDQWHGQTQMNPRRAFGPRRLDPHFCGISQRCVIDQRQGFVQRPRDRSLDFGDFLMGR